MSNASASVVYKNFISDQKYNLTNTSLKRGDVKLSPNPTNRKKRLNFENVLHLNASST